jgi:mannosyltransferase OCH1-like enzyme
MIPKHFHRIWVGPRAMPSSSYDFWNGIRELHPDWKLTTWTDPVRPSDFELGRLFDSCQHPAQLADLMRIEILWRHGGVYVDIDCEVIKPFDPLLCHSLFIGEYKGELQNAVLGSVPQHKGLRAVMNSLLEYDVLPIGPINESTGPVLLTRILASRDDVTVLPKETFFPWVWEEERNPAAITDKTFAVQHWNLSWLPLHRRLYSQVVRRFPVLARIRALPQRLLDLTRK